MSKHSSSLSLEALKFEREMVIDKKELMVLIMVFTNKGAEIIPVQPVPLE